MKFPWNKAERDLQNEIAHHLSELTNEFVRQGYSLQEAQRLARREFGGPEQVKEQCRDESWWAWLTGLRQDLSYGWRTMWKTPGVTIVALLSLALGIGANTSIVSLMDVVLWRSLPVPNPEQLTVVLWQCQVLPRELTDASSGSFFPLDGQPVGDFFSYPAYLKMSENASGKAELAAFSFPQQVSVSYDGRASIAEQRPVGGNFFQVLKTRAAAGRLLSDLDDKPESPAAVVLSHRFWTKYLAADPAVIGRTMRIDNRPFVIVGVLEGQFYGMMPGDATELYVPISHDPTGSERPLMQTRLSNYRYWWASILARRAPGVSESELKPILNTAFRSTWTVAPKDPKQAAAQVFLDNGSAGLGDLRRTFRHPLLVLTVLIGFVLAITCANLANLLLARGTARRKEVAMRISLGCGRSRLIRQLLTESALLAAIGGLLSMAFAIATANLFGQYITLHHDGVPVTVNPDIRTLAIAGLTSIAALILFGLFPAFQNSRVDPSAGLREGPGSIGAAARSWWTPGKLLVVAQMTFSVVLVVTAVLFARNLQSVSSRDPGFDRRNLLIFGLRPGTSGYAKERLPQFYSQLEERLATTPGVKSLGLSSVRPMNIGGWWQQVKLIGGTRAVPVAVNAVTPGYLTTFTGNVIAGRNITPADITNKANVAVISEDLARALSDTSPILGRLITLSDERDGQSIQVVGIAPAVAYASMKERPAVVWFPFEASREQTTVVIRTEAAPQSILPSIQQTLREIDKDLPMVELITMEEQISRGLLRERMFATLCSAFGALALLLSAIGLYGVISYNAARRRMEIGLRMALGALRRDVVWMVVRDGLLLAGVGILLGGPVVWFGAKYVEKELYEMKPLQPELLAASVLLLGVAALIAAWIPAARASMVDPIDALRHE